MSRRPTVPTQYNERLPKGKADADPQMAIDPSERTQDKNIRIKPLPTRNVEALSKGGKVKKVMPITKARVAKGKRK